MKTVFASLIVVSIGCGSYRSGQSAAISANKNDSLTPTSSSPALSAAELNAPSSESPQPQTQEFELWDPNDDRNIAKRLLERVKQEGVVRIVSVLASRDKYVFVGEFEVSAQDVPAERPANERPMNKNGSETLRSVFRVGVSASDPPKPRNWSDPSRARICRSPGMAFQSASAGNRHVCDWQRSQHKSHSCVARNRKYLHNGLGD
jgi:hypothetical protein